MHAGRSVDTTMSFTALDGLLMELDSALLIQRRDLSHARTQHARAVEIEDLLYHRSGLLGISGIFSQPVGTEVAPYCWALDSP
jgi:acetate kinase